MERMDVKSDNGHGSFPEAAPFLLRQKGRAVLRGNV